MTQVDQVILLIEAGVALQREGDMVNQRDHALYAAYWAESHGADDELVASCLLHDLGTVLQWQRGEDVNSRDCAKNHADLGSKYLEKLDFPPRVVALVRDHVDSKRYLAASDAEYERRLTRGSARALLAAGGPMHVEEADQFMAEPLFPDAMRLRLWDDRSYTPPPQPVPDLAYYRPLLTRVLTGAATER